MKNFLSKLWSLSRADRVRTLAIDAVSLPSFCRVNMLKLVSVLVILLTLGVGNAWGDCTTITSRTFGTSDWEEGHTSYTDTWSDLNCDFYRAANNNGGWDYVRMAVKGGSSNSATNTETSYIRNNTVISSKVSKVIINHAGTTDAIGTNLAINWVSLSVYNGSTKIDSVTILAASLSVAKNTAGTIEFTPTSGDTWASGYKYYFYANIFCKGTSNRGLNVSSMQFDNCEDVSCSETPTVGSSLTSVSSTTNSITATVPISAIGGCDITENGLVYSTTNSTPTVGGTGCTKVTVTACGSTAADKEVEITGLTCGTSYYVRGYATNNAGTSYTNVKTQSTSACPTYTITYNAGTGTCGTAQWTQPSYGASTTLPSATAPATCSGYTFAGWCTSSAGSADENTSSPGEILTGSYTPANDITLYAVYTKTIGGGGSSWAETDFADLTSSDVFVLATPAGYALPSNGGDAKPVVSAITVSAGKITSAVTDGLKWNMSGNSTDGYTFYPNGTTSTWLCCTTTASSGSNDNIRINNTGTRKVWILDSDGDLRTNDTYTNRWLCCYNSADFRGYTGSNVTSDIVSKCYKYTTSGTTYYMTSLVCCTQLGTINGSVKWSKEFEDIESPNSFNIYLVYFSMSKIFLSLISVPDSSTIFHIILYFILFTCYL